MKISGKILRFFVIVLISVFFSLTDVYSEEDKARQKADENSKKIISFLQKGIDLLKYEIQRDQLVASRKMLIPGLRQLRIALKKDVGPKEQLINNLKSYLSEKMAAEIGSLQITLNQEKKIIDSNQISPRVKKMTRNIIKKSIPVKEQVLVSFEKVLAEVTVERGSDKTSM